MEPLEDRGVEVPSFDQLKEWLILEYGTDGGPSETIVTNFPYLRCDKISLDAARGVILERPLLFTFDFTKKGWAAFHALTDNYRGIVTNEQFEAKMKEGDPEVDERRSAHVVVLTNIFVNSNSETILRFKNSWGSEVANYGIYNMSANIFKSYQIRDVYYSETDLSPALKTMWEVYKLHKTYRGLTIDDYTRKTYQGESTEICYTKIDDPLCKYIQTRIFRMLAAKYVRDLRSGQ